MNRHSVLPIVSRYKAALMLGGLGFLISAAPEGARLAFDVSAFAGESCLAPAFAGDGCDQFGVVEPAGQDSLSASAALLEPHSWTERMPVRPAPDVVRLEPDLSGLFDFGPEVVHRASPRRNRSGRALRIAAGWQGVPACIAVGRHRPDRSQCATSSSGRRR
jgi:hypothetical protein